MLDLCVNGKHYIDQSSCCLMVAESVFYKETLHGSMQLLLTLCITGVRCRYQRWPEDALEAVAYKFLKEVRAEGR